MWWTSAPEALESMPMRSTTPVPAPSWEVPMPFHARSPRSWAASTRATAASIDEPGVVPGAGRTTPWAPARARRSTSWAVMTAWPEAAAWMRPEKRTRRSCVASRMARVARSMASIVTPVPGLPVMTAMAAPCSTSSSALRAVARRPAGKEATASSTGSRLTAVTRPVQRATSPAVRPAPVPTAPKAVASSPGAASPARRGMPAMRGWSTS